LHTSGSFNFQSRIINAIPLLSIWNILSANSAKNIFFIPGLHFLDQSAQHLYNSPFVSEVIPVTQQLLNAGIAQW